VPWLAGPLAARAAVDGRSTALHSPLYNWAGWIMCPSICLVTLFFAKVKNRIGILQAITQLPPSPYCDFKYFTLIQGSSCFFLGHQTGGTCCNRAWTVVTNPFKSISGLGISSLRPPRMACTTVRICSDDNFCTNNCSRQISKTIIEHL
jgi:hypothetical protein